jgi:hypothetical protein
MEYWLRLVFRHINTSALSRSQQAGRLTKRPIHGCGLFVSAFRVAAAAVEAHQQPVVLLA